jgi:hypothetical protein
VYNDDVPQKQAFETRVGPANPDPVARGQQAWARLRSEQSWPDWYVVGMALQHGRHLAMLKANTNKPRGRHYQDIHGEWLKATGFDLIDKGDRSRLLDCLKHREEIENWRQKLPLNKRFALNHPNSIWRAWRRKRMIGARVSPIAKYKDAIVRLKEENTRLLRAGDDLFLPQDTAADIAQLLADRLQQISPGKAAEILRLLPELYSKRAGRGAFEDFQDNLARRRAGERAA